MFGLFKKKVSISEYAETAEILPVAEDGDYKAFLVVIQDTSKNFSYALKSEGGQDVLQKFVDVIERRISNNEFDNIFGIADQMFMETGISVPDRNTNVERMVICKQEEGYIFKWSP